MIAIDLTKQQALGADVKATQKISFNGHLGEDATICFNIKQKKLSWTFHKKRWQYCKFILL